MTYVDMLERQEGASDTCDFTVQQVTTMSAHSVCVDIPGMEGKELRCPQ